MHHSLTLLIRWSALLLAASSMFTKIAAESANPDLHASSASGLQVEVFSELSPIEINQMHSWLISVKNSDGEAVINSTLTVTGGMPLHDHGLPTIPQVTTEVEPGVYLAEGVRFHMPGPWEILIEAETDGQTHSFVIDLQL